jgi:amidase/aspartyl-tRNA(Asn)/glutamyl-tRNA(Gln) amidotransferase subunit A
MVQNTLAGLPFSAKDLFDVQGETTTAGSIVLKDNPAAIQDCPAVASMRAAGGTLIGRTNMVEFAFSGVGINPHYGTPAAWDAVSNQFAGLPTSASAGHFEPLVPGGSSSGAAVSVATGAAFIGLGSDTGGSIRIPAALNGIVGFKNTARRVSTQGAIPLSTTMDTICAMTRSVRDGILAHEILAHRKVPLFKLGLSDYRIAIPTTLMLDNLSDGCSADRNQTARNQRFIEPFGHGRFQCCREFYLASPFSGKKRHRLRPACCAAN